MSFARYWRRICDEYVKGGRFDEVYDRIRNQIDELVETDPNALYNYEEYTVAAELLYETINLRAESINGQLNGTIPSTDAGQRQDSSHLIDASHIDVTLMGQFNMGGFADNRKGKRDEADDSSSEGFSFPGFGGFFSGDMSGFDPENMPEGSGFPFGGGNMPDMGGFGSATLSGTSKLMTLIVYGLCLLFMLALLIGVSLIRRRR